MLAASCLGLLGRSGAARGRSDRDKRELSVASTMSTSETELIESTYMVTPTSTGGPAIKPNHKELMESTYMVTPTSTGGPEMVHQLHYL
ncbi:hypothetical protein HF086_000200 [Spodoptera exigua]|uniref:Uncharacterized protein n=1 Tax=Spodoptera exigua TaxID=7107 RepID=A0A922S807_SPOEX|nr:hypothetical protein HF086_000200 [Spodoptera exigua]